MFSIKRLRVTLQLMNNVFTNENEKYDTFVIDDAAVQAKIKFTAAGQGTMELSVYGVPNDVINRMTVTKASPKITNWIPNKIRLDLLDKKGNTDLLFIGNIAVAVADYNSAPDVPLQIVAYTWYEAAMMLSQPLSFSGTAKVEHILAVIAKNIGVDFVNNGVTTTMTDVSLNGDAWVMITSLCNAADIDFVLSKNTLKIAPKGQSNDMDAIKISRENGMVGYPRVIDDGVLVTCAFNNEYDILRRVNLYVKEIDAAQGDFVIRGLDHSIDTQTPDGRWYSDLSLSYWAE